MFKNDQDIRPDKILEERLLLLVFMLTATIVSIGFLFAYPAYLRPVILAVFIFIILSIYIAITILQSGETAILYGGLANEILKNRKICYTIVNADGKTVLQNELAKNFLQGLPVLDFLEMHLVNDENNRQKLKQLRTSAEHLKEDRLEVTLKFDTSTIFWAGMVSGQPPPHQPQCRRRRRNGPCFGIRPQIQHLSPVEPRKHHFGKNHGRHFSGRTARFL